MGFPWLVSSIDDDFAQRVPSFRQSMHTQDIRTRASLLLRLGRTRDEVVARCKSYVAWEFELIAQPAIAAQVEQLVDEIVARNKIR